MFREAGRVRGPDQEARRSLVSNIINVCANMEGKEVRAKTILVSSDKLAVQFTQNA